MSAITTLGEILVMSLVESAPLILVAIGFTLLFKLFDFFNISHGEMMTLGGYITLVVLNGVGISLFVSIILAGMLVGVLNILLYLGVFRTFFQEDYEMINMIVISLGTAFILQYAIQMTFGVKAQFFPLGETLFAYEGITMTTLEGFAIGTLVVSILGTHYFLTSTKMGRMVRGYADNKRLAFIHGISSLRMGLIVFFIAGLLGGLGGGFFGDYSYAIPWMGWGQLLTIIAIVIVGGIGNPYGAMLGGFTIALVESTVITLAGNQYAVFASFLILIVVIVLRPKGMLGSENL